MKVSLFRTISEEKWPSMERYASSLASGLSGIGEDLEISEHTISATKFVRYFRPLLRFIPYLKYYANDLYLSRYLLYARRVGNWQGDINHVVDHSYGFLVPHLDASKTVITCHDLIPLTYEKGVVELKVYKHALSGMKQAARIIAVSQATKRRLVKELGVPESKITVVYEGIDRKFTPASEGKIAAVRSKYSLPSGFVILNVGSNLPYKNLEGIILALPEFLKVEPQAFLVKAGAGFTPEQKGLADSLGVGKQLKSIGFVDEIDLPALYGSASVLVSPSWDEGFGFTPLEAMACGCLVIVSDRGSLPEVVGDVGLKVNPDDLNSLPQALVEARQRILEQSVNRGALVARARTFTWDKCARETFKVYQEVYDAKV